MKRLWLSLLVIALLAALSLLNVRYLDRFTASIIGQLENARSLAETGQSEAAFEHTLLAQRSFSDHSPYLHITLDHQDIDEIQSSFGEVIQYLRLGETGAVYVAANSELMIRLALLTEAEQLSLKNIL